MATKMVLLVRICLKNKNMKKIIYFLTLLLPVSVFAHVKWFVDSEEVTSVSHGKVDFYSLGSKEVIVGALIVLVVVSVFSYLDKKIGTPRKLLEFGEKYSAQVHRTAQVILGLFLVTVSFIWKIFIVPEIHVQSSFSLVLVVLQVLVGLMFILNFKPKLASAGLILFCFSLIFEAGFVAFLENLILLSLGIYFYIYNSCKGSYASSLSDYSLEFVRIGTGLSLIVLAFTEKLFYPELSLKFLELHDWNFMVSLFPWFSDKLFVLSTGFAEIIFGVLFILGYMTRTTTILIALFFACSVVTMLVGSNAWEVEDLVVYSAAILFLVYGYGKTKFFKK